MSDHKMTIRAAANHLMLAFKENSKTQAEIKKCAKAMLKT